MEALGTAADQIYASALIRPLPDGAADALRGVDRRRELPEGWDRDLPSFPADAKGMAGRIASAEVLNAIPVVQSYTQESREARRFDDSTEAAFDTARKRTRVRSVLVAFIITATFGALLWGLYQGTQAVMEGHISAGHLGQTVVFVIILVGSVAVGIAAMLVGLAIGRAA